MNEYCSCCGELLTDTGLGEYGDLCNWCYIENQNQGDNDPQELNFNYD